MSNEPNKGRVIITYGRSIIALVAAHSLGQKGIEIIGCDSVDFNILSFSRFVTDHFIYPDPEKDEEAYLDFMLKKVKAYKPEGDRPYVLMPVFDDAHLFAKHKDRFDPYIQLAVPEDEAIAKLHPKDNFARTAQGIGISTPKTWLPDNEEELETLTNDLDFPVLIKPYHQVGGRGIHKVEKPEELIQYWKDNQKKYKQKSLVQELAPGKDYCLTALYDDGKRRASMAYRNVYRFPPGSGAGILRETVDDTRFTKIADKLMAELKWNGVAEFDFLWDEQEDSTPAMIEVNTRFWGGLFQSVESGVDFPWLLYQLTTEGHVDTVDQAHIGTTTKMPYIWLFSALKDVFESDKSEMLEKMGKEALGAIKSGSILEGLKKYTAYLSEYWSDVFDLTKKKDKFKETMNLGRRSKNEFLSSKDPYVVFGILFVLGSLIRHHKLPPEIKF